MPVKLELEYNEINGAAVQPWRKKKEVESLGALIGLLRQVGEVIRPELVMSVEGDEGTEVRHFAVACWEGSPVETEEKAPDVDALVTILGKLGPSLLEQEILVLTEEIGPVTLSATYLESQN